MKNIYLLLIVGINIGQIVLSNKQNYKDVLFIIDAENSFSDKNGDIRVIDGSLAVPGSSKDYERIVNWIENNKNLTEIHISIDLHTNRHIGHPGFWQVCENNQKNTCKDATNLNGLTMLDISPDRIISGYNIVDGTTRIFTPKNYDPLTYDVLSEYVFDYLEFYNSLDNKHGHRAWIWPEHVLEGTDGNKIVYEIQIALNKFAAISGKNVKYHIKGQNNLAEMYSIFSAERPVPSSIFKTLSSYVYTGNNTRVPNIFGENSVDDALISMNLNTNMNFKLMDHIFGITEYTNSQEFIDYKGNNRVFFAGEARTHCVKSSMIDIMDYALAKGISRDRIVLLKDMSSPIPGVIDDLEEIVRKYGFTVQ